MEKTKQEEFTIMVDVLKEVIESAEKYSKELKNMIDEHEKGNLVDMNRMEVVTKELEKTEKEFVECRKRAELLITQIIKK